MSVLHKGYSRKHLLAARIVVAVHVIDDVGTNTMVAPVVVNERRSVVRGVHHGIVCVGRDDPGGNGFGSFRFRQIGLNLR